MEFNITFADISFHFELPTEINIPKEFVNFLTTKQFSQEKFQIQLIDKPLIIEETTFRVNGIKIYKTEFEVLRVFNALVASDGCQVASLLKKDGHNVLYYPKSMWDFYSKEWRCLHLLGIEEILIEYDAFLLHSSLIAYQGKTILFSGPSGIGKSTQASLWNEYKGAEILNGDRTVVRKIENVFYGCGSPWAGTSKIYSNKMAPIAGIVLLKQANENSIKRVYANGFVPLLQQTIVNSWDYDFMDKCSALIGEVLENVPVYELSCRADEEAVMLVYKMLFEGDC